MAKQPNVIVFLTDDQGYGDLSCMGQTHFRTPNMDRMAREGVRFTSWYSNSAVCSPARAALLTGRTPQRAGVDAILAGHRTATGMPPTVPTIAKALKELGYNTYMAGKWHLGVVDHCRPQHHGFDRWFGFLAGCIDYYSHIFYYSMASGQDPVHDLWEDNEEVWDDGRYMTEVITEKCIEYIRDAHRSGKPFFLYVPYNAPHYPMHAPQKYKDRFADLPWDRQIMAAMLSAVDDGVGEIHNELERLGMLDDTLSFIMSDNGPSRETRNWMDGNPDPYYGGTTGGFRGQKFSLYEGGIRVPGIMRWPAGIPGGRVLDTPGAAMDILPTVVEAAGGDPGKYDLDGTSLLRHLAGEAPAPERELYWALADQIAVRQGPWKLVINGREVEHEEEQRCVFLANLDEDYTESTNLAEQHPEKLAELKAKGERWAEEVSAYYREHFSPEAQGTTTHG